MINTILQHVQCRRIWWVISSRSASLVVVCRLTTIWSISTFTGEPMTELDLNTRSTDVRIPWRLELIWYRYALSRAEFTQENSGRAQTDAALIVFFHNTMSQTKVITFRVSRRRREMSKCIVVTRVCVSVCVCLCVCLSAAACLHYCTDPDVTWGSGRGCP